MARILMQFCLLQCLFIFNKCDDTDKDADVTKSFVNHYRHALASLNSETTNTITERSSLFPGMINNVDNSHRDISAGISSDVKDLNRYDIYKHLVQNGGIQTDFTKPSIGFILQVFDRLLEGQGIDRAVGHTDNNKHVLSDTIRSFTAKRSKENRTTAQIPPLPGHEKVTMAEVRLVNKVNNGNRFTVILRRNNKTMIKMKVKSPKSGIILLPKTFVTILNLFHGDVSIILRERATREPSATSSFVDNSPIIVLYSSDQGFMKGVYDSFTNQVNNDTVNTSTRNKRSVNDKERKKKGRRRKNRWTSKGDKPCQMYDFSVDFDLIGWGPWIIHPKKFNARLCYGQCPSPLGQEYSPTNHAMLQTLMKMKRPRSAPEPCCVPTKLQPLSMLYFEYDDIVVRHHEGMITSECGCR
ncbi:hypothetical protein ACF0H5_000395 [Mactra antiquata]